MENFSIESKKVLLASRTRFHAFSIAEELNRLGILFRFVTTVYIKENSFLAYFVKRRDKELIPKNKMSTAFYLLFLHFLPNKILNIFFDIYVAVYCLIFRNRFDIIHCWAGMSFWTCLAGKYLGKQVILERSSTHIVHQHEVLKNLYMEVGEKFRINKILVKQELKEYHLASKIIVPSEYVKSTFEPYVGIHSKVYVSNFGTNLRRSNIPKDIIEHRIIYLGKFSIRKGASFMSQNFKEIKRIYPNVAIDIIGSVEPAVMKYVKEMEAYGINFLGHKSFNQLSSLLNKYTIGIQPSFEEGLSMVVPQLMSQNIVVVASKASGAGDLIEDRSNGLFKEGDGNLFKSIILELLGDREMWTGVHKRLYEDNENLSWKDYGARYQKLLNSL